VSQITVLVLAVTSPDVIASIVADAPTFLDEHGKQFDNVAAQQVVQANRFALTYGGPWSVLLPGDRDFTLIREAYGPEPASLVERVAQETTDDAVILWKAVETVPRGRG
jgi:hypothetical protein